MSSTSMQVAKIETNIPSVLKDKELVHYSTNIDYPKFSKGFHYFIHLAKNTTEIMNRFNGKKKVYKVVNPFEHQIDNYENDIHNSTNRFFKGYPKISSRGFYKMWEILQIFNIADNYKAPITSIHIHDAKNGFAQATSYYRDAYVSEKIVAGDKQKVIPLPNDNESKNDYTKKYNTRLSIYKKSNINSPDTVDQFTKETKKKADLITAEGGFEWENENIQEQEALYLILSEIYTAVRNQAKNGSFVCKFFETFTDSSYNILALLSDFYQEVYLYKPYTSRSSNSEKYAVCTGFKFTDKDKVYKEFVEKLTKLHKSIYNNISGDDRNTDSKIKIQSLFPHYSQPKEFVRDIIRISINIANKQQIIINKIVKFIESNNYYGDSYNKYRDAQISSSEFWIEKFLITKENHIEQKIIFKKDVEESVDKLRTSAADLQSRL